MKLFNTMLKKLKLKRRYLIALIIAVPIFTASGIYAWLNLRQIGLPELCTFSQKTVPAREIKDNDTFVIKNYDNELSFFRIEGHTYIMLATAYRDRQNYSACILNLDDSKTDLGHADVRISSSLATPKFEDIDQDGDKDILLPLILDYDKQKYNYLFQNNYGKYEIIEGAEEHADIKYDKSRALFTSETIVTPYDYRYAEFKAESSLLTPNGSKRTKIYLSITRQSLGDNQHYMYALKMIGNDGSLESVRDSITTEKWSYQQVITHFMQEGLLNRI